MAVSFTLSPRSISKLHSVHPELVAVVTLGLKKSPVDFAVTEGLRSITRQKALVAEGYSQTLNSKHLTQRDGYGHAVDLMAVGDINGDGRVDHQDRNLTWDRDVYSQIAAAILEAADELGVTVRWGGQFKSFFDGPHFEIVR